MHTDILQANLHLLNLLCCHSNLLAVAAVFIFGNHQLIRTWFQIVERKHTIIPIVSRLLSHLSSALIQLHLRTIQWQPLVVRVLYIYKLWLAQYIHQLIARLHPTTDRTRLWQLHIKPFMEMVEHSQRLQLAIVIVHQAVSLRSIVVETTLAQETWHSQRTQHAQAHIVTIERKVTTQQWLWTCPYRQLIQYLQITTALCHLITSSNRRLICITMIQHQQIIRLTIQRIRVNRQEVIHIIRIRLLSYGAQVAVITIAQLCLLCICRSWIILQITNTRLIRTT